MSYTYYFREPQETIKLPEGHTTVRAHREAQWNQQLQCYIFGHAVYPRPLAQDELEQYGLLASPMNHLHAVRKG